MSLRSILGDYLSVRRSLGYKLKDEGHLLSDFVAHVERSGASFITTLLALAWASRVGVTVNRQAKRLSVVRSFAKYVRTLDPRTEIPPPDLLPLHQSRTTPYLYSDEDVQGLITAARDLHGRLRSFTYVTLIGLLATTGIRVGEAIALDCSDVDWRDGLLVIRQGKLRKSREVALHPTTKAVLETYRHERDRVFPRSRAVSFFVSEGGTRLLRQNVHATIFGLIDQAGLAGRSPRRPRIHDLRHSFAVRTLVNWYQAKLDVEYRLPLLSTYLGHVSPASTYWYLTATPDLLDRAAARFQPLPSCGEVQP